MEKTTVKEAVEILRQLSPANQAHFMQLVRMADQAERSVKNAAASEKQDGSFKKSV